MDHKRQKLRTCKMHKMYVVDVWHTKGKMEVWSFDWQLTETWFWLAEPGGSCDCTFLVFSSFAFFALVCRNHFSHELPSWCVSGVQKRSRRGDEGEDGHRSEDEEIPALDEERGTWQADVHGWLTFVGLSVLQREPRDEDPRLYRERYFHKDQTSEFLNAVFFTFLFLSSL